MKASFSDYMGLLLIFCMLMGGVALRVMGYLPMVL